MDNKKKCQLLQKKTKICVVGAGPAGLSVALALQKAGYKEVTVFERSARVGGQVYSKTYTTPDKRTIIYEQCALQPMGSKHLNAIIAEHGLTYSPPRKVTIHLLSENRVVFGGTLKEILSWSFLKDIIKLGKILYRYRTLRKPGLNLESPLDELNIPFNDWIDQQNFSQAFYALLRYSLGGLITFNKNEHAPPAFYGLKILMQAFVPPVRYINGKLVLVKEGYQEIWNRVAKRLDVRLNAKIEKIQRGPQGIEVKLEGRSLHFDKLIIACQEYRNLLDCSGDELIIAERRRSSGSLRVTFIAQHCPLSDMVLSVDLIMGRRENLCIGITGYESFGDGYRLMTASYVLSDDCDDTNVQIRLLTEEVLNYIGGTLVEIISIHKSSDFGTYFNSADVHEGILKRSEARQNRNNTYFVGETLSCGTNALVVDYAFALVERFF
jgi:hypothetical protein